jgi:biopolymer transport protein TolR
MADRRLSAAQRSKVRRNAVPRANGGAGEEEAGEVNVVPFLDIITNVLMFVLATIAVTLTASIDASPPAPIGRRADPTAQRLGLTVVVLRDGFIVSALGQRMGPGCDGPGAGMAVGRGADGDYDYDALNACASKLKALSPKFADENDVTLSAASDVQYEVMVHTMDALRSSRDDADTLEGAKCAGATCTGAGLFPKVSFAVAR